MITVKIYRFQKMLKHNFLLIKKSGKNSNKQIED